MAFFLVLFECFTNGLVGLKCEKSLLNIRVDGTSMCGINNELIIIQRKK